MTIQEACQILNFWAHFALTLDSRVRVKLHSINPHFCEFVWNYQAHESNVDAEISQHL